MSEPLIDGLHEPQHWEVDLALKYGPYGSYRSPDDAREKQFFGDSPALEMDRLLDSLAVAGAFALDLGCGAGFTLCRLSRKLAHVVGVDLNAELLAAAKMRIDSLEINNATLVQCDTCSPEFLQALPRLPFSLVYSRRGPFLTKEIVDRLTPDASFVVELAQDFLGLKEIFGRTPFLPNAHDPDLAIQIQRSVGFVPVSAKNFWFEEYFEDVARLAAYLSMGAPLQHWWLHPQPFNPMEDAEALQLYARYNTNSRGIRLCGHRKLYLFRRQPVDFYPVNGWPN